MLLPILFLLQRNAIIDRQMARVATPHTPGPGWLSRGMESRLAESTLCAYRILPAHRPEAFYLSLK